MIVNNTEVYQIFNNAFTALTKKITSVQLEEQLSSMEMTKNIVTGIISTKGVFHALIICEIQVELFERLVFGMNYGEELSYDEKKQYIREYLNIICGTALTDINNQMGNRSKLSVPHIVEGTYELEQKQEYILKQDFGYCSDYGGMNVGLYYKFLPIYI